VRTIAVTEVEKSANFTAIPKKLAIQPAHPTLEALTSVQYRPKTAYVAGSWLIARIRVTIRNRVCGFVVGGLFCHAGTSHQWSLENFKCIIGEIPRNGRHRKGHSDHAGDVVGSQLRSQDEVHNAG
jgi:hypothetical protein